MEHSSPKHNSYLSLLIMMGLSFIAMYILMYAMVDTFSNIYNSLNQAYMAGLMTTPMLIFEVLLMSTMYQNKKVNALLIGGGILLFILCWFGIRQQAGIGDEQFLRSMIPHHAGAILMCEKASITDPEIHDLCTGIIESQQTEIDLMKAELHELN